MAPERPVNRSEPPAVDRPVALRGARSFATILRWLAGAAGLIGVLEAGAGAAYGEPRALLLGVAALAFGTWVAGRAALLDGPDRTRIVTQIAVATLGLEALAAVLQPSVATAMAIASLLPAVLVVPIVSSSILLRLLILGGLVGGLSEVAARFVPESTAFPAPVETALALLTLVLAYVFLIVFLWEVSRSLKSSAADLQSVVTMSGDLAQTLDPRLVGDRIALHIARAVNADDVALSHWDRTTDRVVTLGYYPPERRGALHESYALSDYPATRRVLEEQVPDLVDGADPIADPAEIAYLGSIRQRTMAMIPLVAAGRSIGLIELTSSTPGAFDGRAIELATMLAGEAAMALENARLYDEIRHRALHDTLTGLANRVLFRERVEHAVARSRGRSGRPFAVLFIDLDDFKTLNDTLGHARGDEVLAAAAARVAGQLRPGDTAARLGGDEFAVLLEDVADEAAALSTATRLVEALRLPLDLGHLSVRVAASVGVAMSGAGETADDLLRNADVAMYAAKRASRGGAEVFQPAMRDEVAARNARAELLRGVEQRGELRLDFQPIVELGSGDVIGLEALIRWQPPEGPPILPDGFIDLAEETGDIVPIGRWVLREACRQLRDWQVRLGLPGLRVSVNISVRQFREHDFVTTVEAALAENDVDPACLILEITESGLMSRTEGSIGRLEALRALGVHLAIDDFGTGYSSLSYLERFPIDILKIDRAFVSAGGTPSAIAAAVIDLGRTLGLEVIAEGLEEPSQAERLVELGCRLGQGYLFARPMRPEALEAILAEGAGTSSASAAPGRSDDLRRAGTLRLVSGE